MIELMRFALIIFVTVVDYVAHEIVLSFKTTSEFVRYRVRWIVRDKVRSLWSGQR
jgi:hypothetical protein